MPKDFSLANLMRDLEYIVYGTNVHKWLYEICNPIACSSVLEPGCGSGKLGLAYALVGCPATLIDIDKDCIKYASRLKATLDALLNTQLRASISEGDIHKLPFGDNSYEFVFNEGVPQHWTEENDRQGAINEMARVCKTSGTVAIIGNNGLSPKEQEIDKTFRFGYKGMPPNRMCFTPDELKNRMEKAGLVDIKMEPLGTDNWNTAVLFGAYGRKK